MGAGVDYVCRGDLGTFLLLKWIDVVFPLEHEWLLLGAENVAVFAFNHRAEATLKLVASAEGCIASLRCPSELLCLGHLLGGCQTWDSLVVPHLLCAVVKRALTLGKLIARGSVSARSLLRLLICRVGWSAANWLLLALEPTPWHSTWLGRLVLLETLRVLLELLVTLVGHPTATLGWVVCAWRVHEVTICSFAAARHAGEFARSI